jgi:hypothetical protein
MRYEQARQHKSTAPASTTMLKLVKLKQILSWEKQNNTVGINMIRPLQGSK